MVGFIDQDHYINSAIAEYCRTCRIERISTDLIRQWGD
jgi:hypothetical protein